MDCPRFNKWIRGCKYEPRYDLSSPDLSRFVSIDRVTGGFMESLKAKTYRGDVCVRCGKPSVAPNGVSAIPEQGQ